MAYGYEVKGSKDKG